MEHQTAGGKPYSASHPIPKINEFLKEINPASKKNRQDESNVGNSQKDQVKALKHGEGYAGNRRVVTDPTTGNEVEIEDVTGDYEQAANGQPKISVPNQSLPSKEGQVSYGLAAL